MRAGGGADSRLSSVGSWGGHAAVGQCANETPTLIARALSRYEVENELHNVEGIHYVLHNTFGMKLLHIGVMKCFITRFIT